MMGAIIIPRVEGRGGNKRPLTQIWRRCFLSAEAGSIWARIKGLDQERSWTNLSEVSVKTPWTPGIISVLFLSSCATEPQNDHLKGLVSSLFACIDDGLFAVGCTVMRSKYTEQVCLFS